MEITRNVILDLLPLYLADEVTDDSRKLVEMFLEGDSELAEIAASSKLLESKTEIPIPLTKENQMEALMEAKRLMFWRTVVIGAVISFALLVGLALAALAALFMY